MSSEQNNGPALLVAIWTGAAISLIFVVLRVCSRCIVSRVIDWTDGVVIFGWILNIASASCCTIAVHYGLGRHTETLSIDEINYTSYWANVLQPMGIYSYCFPKLAIAALIIRLMVPPRAYVITLYALMIWLFIMSFLASIFLFVRCKPYNHFWHPLEKADCWPATALNAVTAIAGSVSAISDLVLAIFPTKVIFGLQMKLGQKIGIMVLMGLGFIAMVAAITKTSMLHKESSQDATYVLFPLLIAHYIEVNIVIICATAPFIPTLFAKYFGKQKSNPPSYPQPNIQTFGQSGGSRGYRPFESQESGINLQDTDVSKQPNSNSSTTELNN